MRLLPENDKCQYRIQKLVSKRAISVTDFEHQKRLACKDTAYRLTEHILREHVTVTESPDDDTVLIEGEVFVFTWPQLRAEMQRAFEAGREDRMRYGP